MKNKCSSLNIDLFRNRIRNTPLCDLCDVVEDAENILLKDMFSMIQLVAFIL